MRRLLATPTAAAGAAANGSDSRSFKPEQIVVRDIPVAFATVLTPPRPRVRASTAAHRRNIASSNRSARARYLSSIVPASLIPEKCGNHPECSSYFCWDPKARRDRQEFGGGVSIRV